MDFTSKSIIFRYGCHGLHVDTGQFKAEAVAQRVDRDHRFCLVCAFDTAEDELHLVFDCPACCSIRARFTTIFWVPAPTLSSLFTLYDHRFKFLHERLAHRSQLLESV